MNTILKALFSIFLSACSMSSLLPLDFTLTHSYNPHIYPFQMQSKKGARTIWIPSCSPPYHHRSGWSHRAGRWRKPSGSCPLQTRPPGTRSFPPSSGQKRSCSPAPSSWMTGQHPPEGDGGTVTEKWQRCLPLKNNQRHFKMLELASISAQLQLYRGNLSQPWPQTSCNRSTRPELQGQVSPRQPKSKIQRIDCTTALQTSFYCSYKS